MRSVLISKQNRPFTGRFGFSLVAGSRFARESQGYEPCELLLLYPAISIEHVHKTCNTLKSLKDTLKGRNNQEKFCFVVFRATCSMIHA